MAAEQVLTPVYDEALEVTLYTATPGAQIRYTLDGSSPRPEHGDLYEHPIRIETTTVLSAAYRPDGSLAPSSVVVHTYIFVNHVAQQEGDRAVIHSTGLSTWRIMIWILKLSRTQRTVTRSAKPCSLSPAFHLF
ncbi:chitobiase/beta-hexosaminidase C-terminal domain-containing protein [Chloroflexi bacterium TSY]|nr:chitobiase/beta-hexosaminidase C-terminal domain-containing protein [Chloroflexi bacterium TSY]